MAYNGSASSLFRQERMEIETRIPFRSVRDAVSMFGGVDGNKSGVETRLPFNSVRDAVSMFGGVNGGKTDISERKLETDGKKHRFPEKWVPKEGELYHSQELVRVREQLSNAEQTKLKALLELSETKKKLEEMNKRLEDTYKEMERENNGTAVVLKPELMLSNAQEQQEHMWEIEFKEMQEQHIKLLAELDIAKLDLDKLRIISEHEQEKSVTLEAELKEAREQHGETLAELDTARQELVELRINSTQEWGNYTAWELKFKETEEHHIKSLAELEAAKQELEVLRIRTIYEQEKSIVFQNMLEKTKEEHMKALAELETENRELKSRINTSQLEEYHVAWDFRLKETKKQCMEAVAELETTKQELGELKGGSTQEEENHAAWEFELKETKQQHMKILAELETAKQEIDNLKRELQTSLNEKASIVKLAEEALTAAEVNCKRVEELTVGIHGTTESLALVKKELTIAKELELKLGATTDELERLRTELATAKDAEESVAKTAAEAVANLDHVKSELDRTRISEANAISSLTTLSTELQEAKANLQVALDDGISLRTLMDSLQNELQLVRSELGDLKKREANGTTAVAVLTGELTRTKSELVVAAAAETKANEVISDLYQVLQQVTDEAEEARLQAEALGEEAWKARADAEHAKTAMNTAESKLLVALQEANVAKAAEVVALGRIRALSEQKIAARSSVVEDAVISQEEYDALLKKMQDAEDLASLRVSAARTHVEAVRAGKHKIEQELEIANQKMDDMRKVIKQALHRAEMAEAAKDVAENELRTLREKKVCRSTELLLAGQQPYVWNDNSAEHSFSLEIGKTLETSGEDMEDIKRVAKQALHRAEIAEAAKAAVEAKLKRLREENRRREREIILAADESDGSLSFETPPAEPLGKVLTIEPLGKVLNIKIPSEPGHRSVERLLTPKKKNNLLPSIGGYLVKKRPVDGKPLS